ncbi:hypothetical protein FQN54_008645 [Arachnomyces sp. PD_36]|nr:hypothetical protein FQN54_008645 [Arachnomyces sp. PD_36]
MYLPRARTFIGTIPPQVCRLTPWKVGPTPRPYSGGRKTLSHGSYPQPTPQPRLRVNGISVAAFSTDSSKTSVASYTNRTRWIISLTITGIFALGLVSYAGATRGKPTSTVPSLYFETMPGGKSSHSPGIYEVSEEESLDVSKLPREEAVLTSAPNVPPPITRDYPVLLQVPLTTLTKLAQLTSAYKYEQWTFNGTVPGPFIRARVGDVVELTLTNRDETGNPHNIDCHAFTGPGGGSALTTAEENETKTGKFQLLYPGLYLYHCAAAPVPVHIANGMYGLMYVQPTEGDLPPVDREYYVMQSEFYHEPPEVLDNGRKSSVVDFSYPNMLREEPDSVVFNGSESALTLDQPLKAQTNESVRIFFGNAGPNLTSAFHVIGSHFKNVYRDGGVVNPPANFLQTVSVPPGSATIVDLKMVVPGTYTIVDHAISRLDKGAVGYLNVSGKARPDIYQSAEPPAPCVGYNTVKRQLMPAATPILCRPFPFRPAARGYRTVMVASRLPFLYPNFVRSIRSCEPTTYRSLRLPPQNHGSHAGFHSGRRREQEQYHQRYGPAAEPRLSPKSPNETPPPQPAKDGEAVLRQGEGQVAEKAQTDKENNLKKAKSESTPDSGGNKADSVAASSSNIASELPPQDNEDGEPTEAPEESSASSPQNQKPNQPNADTSQNPLETVFQMPPPPSESDSNALTTTKSDAFKPPHLSARPYVHHFDTYTLVRDLERGGFSEAQSITIMKAIRALLAENLEMARDGLISKSDTENETYLFLAACSELRTSIQASRNSEIQQQRSQRAQLQHEVDILTQRMTQELAALKDDLKGVFNDRKMSTKETQRSLDTAIQELNYQITVSLNSDGKSEAEGLRWILTRRAAMAIAISASMMLLALNYSSYNKQHEKEIQEQKAPKPPPPPPSAETMDHSTQTEASPPPTLISESLG